jgi:uncharacterized protein YigE (DUF2233 family)
VKATLAALVLWIAAPAAAATCTDQMWEGTSFTTCVVSIQNDDLQLFLNGADGTLLGSFAAIEADTGRRLAFAMNAGMYHPDRRPVGLYIEDAEQVTRLVTGASSGNFGMVPNGLLCITQNDVRIVETNSYLDDTPDCRFASQSGPMLLMGDEVHPRFIPGSTSRYIRNGVGTGWNDEVYFVISNDPVNFYDFARFFRDALGVSNALYFDGKISRLYAPDLGRNDAGFPMGPMVGVLLP